MLLRVGSTAYISDGVYFIRGHFVDIQSAYIILEQYDNNPSYRVGFEVSESIITPEDDPSLTDNAIGSSNYSAPGGHRFRIKTQLVKKLQSMTTPTRTSSNCFASGTRLLRTLLTVRNITRSKSRLLVERMRHMATTLSIPSMFVQEST